MEDPIKSFINFFQEGKFLKQINRRVSLWGQQLLYMALLLFYAYKRSDTPKWAKHTVLGALGYLLAPFDSIPDLTPFIGMTDDFGILSFAMVIIACYIDKDVRSKAIIKLEKIVDQIDQETITRVNKML